MGSLLFHSGPMARQRGRARSQLGANPLFSACPLPNLFYSTTRVFTQSLRLVVFSNCTLHSFDVKNPWNSLNGTNHLIQVFDIKHFDRDFNVPFFVRGDGGSSVA